MRTTHFVTGIVITMTVFVTGCGLLFNNKKSRTPSPPEVPEMPEISNNASSHRSGSGEAPGPIVNLSFDSTVYNNYQEIIRKDLEILSNAGLTDSSDTDTLGINSFDNANLSHWLSDRVKVIVGPYYTESKYIEKTSVQYPEISLEYTTMTSATTMRNVGAGIYATGRQYGRLYSVYINGIKSVVNSPRVGIIKIEDGFLSARRVSESSDMDDVNSYLRISVLFHEGRHSDGNGADVGLLHASCDSGDYFGQYACDRYTNGPYSVARVILEKFRKICKHCNSKEKKALDLNIADNASRVLDRALRADPSPESVAP